MLDAIRIETTAPPLAARNLAILHVAMLRVVDSSPVTDEVAIDEAALTVCEALYPGQSARFAALASRSRQSDTAKSRQVGRDIAERFLNERADDGANSGVTYIPREEPGQWRRTPPFFRPPELPHWPNLRPFSGALAKAIQLSGPPAWDSAEFRAACAEIDRLGRKDSPDRTEEQTLIAKFWSDFSYTVMPPGHWDVIAADLARSRGLDVRQTARLFALLNVAQADSGIACWQAKYKFNAWRPVTALNAGRALTEMGASLPAEWQTLLPTPPHPEYPSGHSAFSGAAAEVIAAFFGTDECAYEVGSDAVPGVTRKFTRLSVAAEEIGWSRVYAGIHFSYACRDGAALGRSIGKAVAEEAGFKVIPVVSSTP